jgi:uncharacterized protein (UPF0254 family)
LDETERLLDLRQAEAAAQKELLKKEERESHLRKAKFKAEKAKLDNEMIIGSDAVKNDAALLHSEEENDEEVLLPVCAHLLTIIIMARSRMGREKLTQPLENYLTQLQM